MLQRNRENLGSHPVPGLVPWFHQPMVFGVRATYHTTLEATPAQLVFGRDAILPIQHRADWKYIQNKKQKLINMNNKRENRTRIPHEYKVGDMILVSRNKRSKHGEREKMDPIQLFK